MDSMRGSGGARKDAALREGVVTAPEQPGRAVPTPGVPKPVEYEMPTLGVPLQARAEQLALALSEQAGSDQSASDRDRERDRESSWTEPERAALLDAVEADERVVRGAEARLARRLGAAYAAALAATEGLPDAARELELRSATAEMGLALDCSCRSAMRRMAVAHALAERFPVTLDRWEAGRIDRARAELVERHGSPIEDSARRTTYEAEALWHAEQLTPGRLEPVLRRLSEQARELSLDERAREAVRLRRVSVESLGDGMAALTLVLREWQAHAIYDRVTTMALDSLAAEEEARAEARAEAARESAARTSAHAGEDAPSSAGDSTGDDAPGDAGHDRPDAEGRADERSTDGDDRDDGEADDADAEAAAPLRTLDEARADTLAELMLQADPAEIVGRPDRGAARVDARVSITVPILSILGESREPAELLGVGPVPLETAKSLAAEQPTLERILTDPITEVPLAVDRYRPSAAMRRVLAVRDETCRFPGCVRRAERCDLDHTHDAAKGGETSVGNLAHLCRRHHVLKHQTPWRARQLEGGVIEWTSPSGRVKVDRPSRSGPEFVPRPEERTTEPEPKPKPDPEPRPASPRPPLLETAGLQPPPF
ncbi:hypothetical protein USB125703_00857 [Pseudoclavibacter triregionum]|nr:hypothetical protein USB125703_00857 [Pseudoclavibacter triregionum]